MKSTGKLRIGLETRLFSGAMTGVGNYSFHLLLALARNHPDLTYIGFGLGSWSILDADALQMIEGGHQKHAVVASSRGGRTMRVIRYLKARGRSQIAGLGLAEALYRVQFLRTVKHQSLDLFHAFNYVPMADPGVVTLPVVYDLSFVRFPEFHPKARLRRLERLPSLLKRSPRVQTISQFSRNEIASYYGYDPDRIFVAPPAAAGIFRPLGLEITRRDLVRFDVGPGKFLLAVGTLEPRKNLQTLVAAYARIPRASRDRTPLVIVGGAGWGELKLPLKQPHSSARVASGFSVRLLMAN